MDITKFVKDLEYREGIWYSRETYDLSYPADGNDACFQVEESSFWFKYRNEVIYQAVKTFSIPGPVFDLGGGNGIVSNFLVSNKIDTILVEPGFQGCVNGRKRGLRNIVNSEFTDKHFNSQTIPNVGIFDVLEHIEDQNSFLEKIRDKLIPDGRLFITVPAYRFLWSDEDDHAGHYNRYKKNELIQLLDSSGFEVLYSTYFFPILILPIFLFRTIPSKLKLYSTKSTSAKRQHNSYFGRVFIGRIMQYEVNMISHGKSLCTGSSLLVVCRKKQILYKRSIK